MSLEALRHQIDAVDEEILDLIMRRVQIAHAIGREKKGVNKQIEDKKREEQVLKNLRYRAVQKNLAPQDIENIYTHIIQLCRNAQNL